MTFIVQTVLLIFPHWCPGQQHMHRQETIDTTVPLTARVTVFIGNYTSIIYHFCYNEVFLLAEDDVIALHLLGIAVSDSPSRILIERLRFYISV